MSKVKRKQASFNIKGMEQNIEDLNSGEDVDGWGDGMSNTINIDPHRH